MSTSASEPLLVLPRSIGPIKEPNKNDVLCGRGGGVNEHSGNIQMRGFTADVRREYMNSEKLKKQKVVKGVVDRIRALDPPGRFLKKDSDTGLWWDVGDKQAWKKVARALRDSVPDKNEWEQYRETFPLWASLSSVYNGGLQSPNGNGHAIPSSYDGTTSITLPSGALQACHQSIQQHHALHVSEMQVGRGNADSPQRGHNSGASTEFPAFVVEDRYEMRRKKKQESVMSNEAASRSSVSQHSKTEEEKDIRVHMDPEEEGAFMSMFYQGLENVPKFTEEEARREQEETTEEEHMATLSDLFGDFCDIVQRKKKVARDFRGESTPVSLSAIVPTRLGEMKSELERTPLGRKGALVEALGVCSPNEFSDARMKLFLCRENMNAKLAMNRFLDYWEKRRELFGVDKFHLPMTLSGALRDDRKALEAGVFSVLPEPDASGRPILYYLPHLNTRDGYRVESMLRAIWYIFESVSERSANSNVVVISNWKDGTLWDYDREFEISFLEMERYFLPLRFCAMHATGLPPVLIRVLSPVVRAFMDKECRARLIPHHHEGEALLNVLESYGIKRDAVPSDMGGECRHDYHEWLNTRERVGK